VKVSRFDTALVYLLLAINLWISYTVLQDLSHQSGMALAQSYAWPLAIDVLILVSTRNVVQFGKHPARRYAWFLLVLAAAASVTFNIRHILLMPQQVDVATSIAVGAVAPIGALLVTHLATKRSQVMRDLERGEPDAAPAAPVPLGWLRNAAATARDAKTILAGKADAAPAATTAAQGAAPAAAQVTDVAAPTVTPLRRPYVVPDAAPSAAPDAAPTAAFAAPEPDAAPDVPHPATFAAPPAADAAPPAAQDDVDLDTLTRQRAAELIAEGLSYRAVARVLKEDHPQLLSPSDRTIRRWTEAAAS
jgi:hypothetical protein